MALRKCSYSVARSLQNNDQKDIPLKDFMKARFAFAICKYDVCGRRGQNDKEGLSPFC